MGARFRMTRRGAGRLVAGALVCAAAQAALLGSMAPGAAAAQAPGERIERYNVGIAVQRDGSLLVDERIVYDFGADAKHGIFREIPVRFPYSSSYDRVVQVAVRSVWSPDAPAEYQVTRSGSAVTIRIGDPGRLVTGVHTYELAYLVRGGMNASAGRGELYWDAVGNQWNVPIDSAAVRVTAPAAVTRARCFAGPQGSVLPCLRASATKTMASFSQPGLAPREGLTVAVTVGTQGMKLAPPLLERRHTLLLAFSVTRVSLAIGGGLLVVLVAAGAGVFGARRRRRGLSPAGAAAAGRAPASGEGAVGTGNGWQAPGGIPGQASPDPSPGPGLPAGIRPGQAGVLLRGVISRRDLTATLVDLAMRGYLRIEQSGELSPLGEPQWRLVGLRKPGGLLGYERTLLTGLFDGSRSVLLSELGPGFASTLAQARTELYTDVAERGWFPGRPDQARRRWRACGIIMAVVSAAVMLPAARFGLALAPVPALLAGLALAGGARWMPERTAAGAGVAHSLRRFRDAVVAPSALHHRHTGQPDTLYGSLPWAIAFGCTEEWAKLTSSFAASGQAPAWYADSGTFQPRCLNSLPGALPYFSPRSLPSRVSAQGISKAASGWASGGSGFGGGGFAGGGGGGGGGGSW